MGVCIMWAESCFAQATPAGSRFVLVGWPRGRNMPLLFSQQEACMLLALGCPTVLCPGYMLETSRPRVDVLSTWTCTLDLCRNESKAASD